MTSAAALPPAAAPSSPRRSPLLIGLCVLCAALVLSTARLPTLSVLSHRGAAAAAAAAPRKCPHVIVFTAARHGSTWFVDSVERCRYSESTHKNSRELFDSDVFRLTEPWKHKGNYSPLNAMSAAQVAGFVHGNSTVKVFPSTLGINRTRILHLIQAADRLHVPFVVLRRNLRATFRSLKIAEHTKSWNGNKESSGLSDDVAKSLVHEEQFQKYKKSTEGYFKRVYKLLQEAKVMHRVDTVDYDNISQRQYFRFTRANCFVRNCNF